VKIVKKKKEELKKHKDYEHLAEETEEKLKDVLYLPIEYESEIDEENND
jgi:hypothetical protein